MAEKKSKVYYLRLFTLVAVILEIGLGFISAFFLYGNANKIADTTIKTTNGLLTNIRIHVDDSLDTYRTLLENSVFVETLYQAVEGKEEMGQFRYSTAIQELLQQIATSNTGICSVAFVSRDGQATGYQIPIERITAIEEYVRQCEDSTSGKSRLYAYLDNGTVRLVLFKTIKFVDYRYTIHPVGSIMIELDHSVLQTSFEFEQMDTSMFYICDDQWNILSSGNDENIGKRFYDIYQGEEYSELLTGADGERYGSIFQNSDAYNIITVAMYSKAQMERVLYQPLIYTGSIVLLSILVSLFICRLFLQISRQDRQRFDLELEVKKAQIAAYESQINPHFLYNSLQMIQMMGLIHDFDGIQEATSCLGEVLRYSLQEEREVPISAEIENMEYYFRLIKLKYRGSFEYQIDVRDEIRRCKMMKFILQPIVENAIKHGIEAVDRKGEVRLLAREFANEIVLIVRDNGRGMTEDEVRQLQQSLDQAEAEENGRIGLKNVSARIKLYYGEQYGLTIQSEYNVRTDVMIHIPATPIKEGDNVSDDYR